VVFEDAEKGMHAAIAGEIPVVVVRTPETARIDFAPASLVLDSHAELLDLARRTR
jgi:beta-phosphoglucomutase-like phosphatase (HAD superfamily)